MQMNRRLYLISWDKEFSEFIRFLIIAKINLTLILSGIQIKKYTSEKVSIYFLIKT